MDKIKAYLAGSMFCEADRLYNSYLAQLIRTACGDKIDLYVPQENASINDKTKCADSRAIFWGDYNRLQNCDIFIARIDGDIPPSGTSAEIGIMSQRIQALKQLQSQIVGAKEIKDESGNITIIPDIPRLPLIIGLCTDSRNPKATYLEAKNELMKNGDIESQYCYFNLFTIGCIKENGCLVTSSADLIKALEEEVNARI